MQGVAGQQQGCLLPSEVLLGEPAHRQDGQPGQIERADGAEPAQQADDGTGPEGTG